MKPVTLQIVFLLCSLSLSGQPNFSYYYTPVPGANNSSRAIIAKGPDGCLMGITTSTQGIPYFTLYKIDPAGNMLWQHDLLSGFSSIFVPYMITPLPDSTFVISIQPQLNLSSTDCFIIVKCDLSGNVLWANRYSTAGGATSLISVSPYLHGGILASFQQIAVYIDASGNVVNGFQVANSRIYDSDPTGNSGHTVMGFQFPGISNLSLFEMDVAGTVSNAYTYTFGTDSIQTSTYIPYYKISRTSNGNVYCTQTMKSGAGTPQFLGVFKFDAQNQPLWAKKVQLPGILATRSITATRDHGCIAVATYIHPVNGFYPFVIRFDSTGNVLWHKTLGDPPQVNYMYNDILSIIPDSSGGWYSTVSKNNVHLFHTDSLFNGYCIEQSFQPTVSTMPVTTVSDTVTTNPQGYIATPFGITQTPVSIYKYDACTGVLIDSVTAVEANPETLHSPSVYPNPAGNYVSLQFPEPINKFVVAVFNTLGENVLKESYENVEKATLDVAHLKSGAYVLQISSAEGAFFRKMIIKH